MSGKGRFAVACMLATAVAVGASGLAVAQDRDTEEVSRYVLTESGLAKFTQASRNLAAIPGACDQADDDSGGPKSIDDMVAMLNAEPAVQGAIQSAGMTTREYVLFMFSILQNGLAAWALSQPGGKLPPGVSQANVDFYKRHEAAMVELDKSDPCESETP